MMVGASHKLSLMNSFYVGETIMKVVKTQITPGGRDVILYATIYGTIGVLVPFQSREDVEFYTNLEMHVRQETKSLVGRDHTSFRGYYTPVKARLCALAPFTT
jgi:splicing factor 3B subunit 3